MVNKDMKFYNLEEGETLEHMAHRVWVATLHGHGCTCDLESMKRDPDCPINHRQPGLEMAE
jgi:hypothetical protein